MTTVAMPRLDREVTAYEMLTEVLPAVFREEHRRVRMHLITAVGGDELLDALCDFLHDHRDDLYDEPGYEDLFEPDEGGVSVVARAVEATLLQEAAPACGSVGCVGGWVDLMVLPDDLEDLRDPLLTAGKILGLSEKQRSELFFPKELCAATNAGTREHAEAVIAHMALFAGWYAAQLKDTVVRPGVRVW